MSVLGRLNPTCQIDRRGRNLRPARQHCVPDARGRDHTQHASAKTPTTLGVAPAHTALLALADISRICLRSPATACATGLGEPCASSSPPKGISGELSGGS